MRILRILTKTNKEKYKLKKLNLLKNKNSNST